MIKVSVITPTYNRSESLRILLKSLDNQSYPKKYFEVIIVDDGSRDNTERMIKDFMSGSKLKLVYIKQKNKGSSPARNTGIKNANGDIIAFIDSDCIADTKWIENGVKGFNDIQVGGVEGKTVTYKTDITPLTRLVVNENGNMYMTCNIFYRKETLLYIYGFDEKLPLFREDTDLAWRIMDSGYKIIFNPEAIVTHPPAKFSITRLLKWDLKIKKAYWDAYLCKKNPRRYRKEIALFGIFNPHTIAYYPIYFCFLLFIYSLFTSNLLAVILAFILLLYAYVTSVLIYTNQMIRGMTFLDMFKYKNELIRILGTWWLIALAQEIYGLLGMIRFRTFLI